MRCSARRRRARAPCRPPRLATRRRRRRSCTSETQARRRPPPRTRVTAATSSRSCRWRSAPAPWGRAWRSSRTRAGRWRTLGRAYRARACSCASGRRCRQSRARAPSRGPRRQPRCTGSGGPPTPRTSPPRRRRGDARRARREGTRRRPRRPRRRRGRAEGQARACHGRSASRRRCRARRRPRVCRRRGGRAPRRARGGRGGGEGHRGRCLSAREGKWGLGAVSAGVSSGVETTFHQCHQFGHVDSGFAPRRVRPETLAGISEAARACPISLGVGGALVLSRKSFLPPPRLQTCARHRVAH